MVQDGDPKELKNRQLLVLRNLVLHKYIIILSTVAFEITILHKNLRTNPNNHQISNSVPPNPEINFLVNNFLVK